MGAAVDLEHAVVEVLDAQAQARHSERANGPQLVLGQGPGLGLERDLLGRVPGEQRLHPFGQVPELLDRQIRRRPSAEVDEARLAVADERFARIEAQLVEQSVNVGPDLGGIPVGVDLVVAEMAALAAEGNVQVDAERRAPIRRALEGGREVSDQLRLPERKRWIVGDEVVSDAGLFLPSLREPGCHREVIHIILNDTPESAGLFP